MPDFNSMTLEHDVHTEHGVYSMLRSIDENIREQRNELYAFRRDTKHDLTEIKSEINTLKSSDIKHDKSISMLQNDVLELKESVKELRRDVSDIKGDIRAIAAGFGAAQNRFNWGLIILGLFVALIQLLK